MSTFLYAIYDEYPNGAIPINKEDAWKFNNDGYGIFFAIQHYKQHRRKAEDVDYIRCFAIDIDSKTQTKDEMRRKIIASPILPSLVVESKNGYHVYWILKKESWIKVDSSKDDAYKYKEFLKSRIAPVFDADRNACDITRILRMPGFYHLKDQKDPFLVNDTLNTGKLYSLDDIKKAFPVVTCSTKKSNQKITYSFDKNDSCSYIKNKVLIIDLVKKLGIPFREVPDGFLCQCPSPNHSHGDRRPSLKIYNTNTFNCFGCGIGGDVITFYKTYIENLNAGQIVLKLKQMFNR